MSAPQQFATQARLFALRRRVRRQRIPLLLQLKAARLPAPELEFHFAPHRQWRFDFAWTPWMIACEVEGGVFSNGRHVSGVGYTNDCIKYNHAAILGWLVIRATTEMVDDGRAIVDLRDAFKARGLE